MKKVVKFLQIWPIRMGMGELRLRRSALVRSDVVGESKSALGGDQHRPGGTTQPGWENQIPPWQGFSAPSW